MVLNRYNIFTAIREDDVNSLPKKIWEIQRKACVTVASGIPDSEIYLNDCLYFIVLNTVMHVTNYPQVERANMDERISSITVWISNSVNSRPGSGEHCLQVVVPEFGIVPWLLNLSNTSNIAQLAQPTTTSERVR
jgi:hypothetical protein